MYDNAARQAGYCVNQCARVGDLLDSDTFNALGEYTTAKGVKAVNKATALTLLSAPAPTPITASGKRDGAGAEPSASAALAPPSNVAAAPRQRAAAAVPDAASEAAHAASPAGWRRRRRRLSRKGANSTPRSCSISRESIGFSACSTRRPTHPSR